MDLSGYDGRCSTDASTNLPAEAVITVLSGLWEPTEKNEVEAGLRSRCTESRRSRLWEAALYRPFRQNNPTVNGFGVDGSSCRTEAPATPLRLEAYFY